MSSIDRRNAEYGPLIQDFKNDVKDVNIKGITGPHFPGVGECYDLAKYKFAFCGMETYGWNMMEDFMLRSEDEYLSDSDTRLNDLEHLGWMANGHATFWAFVFKFLAKFYKVDFKKLVAKEGDVTSSSILKSFVWANANCIERYEVTSKWEGAEIDSWNVVKSASRRFDDLNHIINSCMPKVIFIIYSGVDEKKYILNETTLSDIFGKNFEQRRNVLKLNNENPKYNYYYLRDSATHVFHLPHPTWMGLYSGIGIDNYVDSLIKDIVNYNVWDTLPKTGEDWQDNTPSVDNKATMDYKAELIASIAHSLVPKMR